MAFGLIMAFGRNLAFGHNLAFGLTMAFGRNLAFGHNLAVSLIMAFGHNLAFGLIMAFGLNDFVKCILVGKIGLIGIIDFGLIALSASVASLAYWPCNFAAATCQVISSYKF